MPSSSFASRGCGSSRRGVVASIAIALLAGGLACTRSGAPDGKENEAGADGSAAAPARLVSCDRVASAGICSEYSGTYLAQNELLVSSSCAKLGGTLVPAVCPNTSVLGACTLSTTERRRFYAAASGAGGAFDAARAKKECETVYAGKWSSE